MGSGTSVGVPMIGCDCDVCKSKDPRDNRMRASAFVTDGDKNIVIDVGPEFRLQAIRQGIKKLDAVLLTHGHADHLHGLDDVRMFSSTKQQGVVHKQTSFWNLIFGRHGDGLKVFADRSSRNVVLTHFDYIFRKTQKGGGKPRIDLWQIEKFSEKNPLQIGTMRIIPIPMMHGSLPTTGYLFSQTDGAGKIHSIAYLTDLNYLSDQAVEIINRNKGILEHAVIDGLRVKPHSTHFGFLQTMECAEKIAPRHTWFTHMTHDMSHVDVCKYIEENLHKFPALEKIVAKGGSVAPGFDGLVLEV